MSKLHYEHLLSYLIISFDFVGIKISTGTHISNLKQYI